MHLLPPFVRAAELVPATLSSSTVPPDAAGGRGSVTTRDCFPLLVLRRCEGRFVRGRNLGCEGVRARHDLEDFLGDLGLASAVHGEGETVDQLARVLGCV